MKKKNIYLIFSLLALIVLSYFAYTIANEEKVFSGTKTTIEEAESAFLIEDTASITKIIITNQDKQQVILERVQPDLWRMNNEFQARIDGITTILKTARRIEAREKVSDKGKENIVKNIAVSHHKVEYFSGDTWLKTWYVGSPTQDASGSFMILETPENGKSENPYITHIPGFTGELSAPFYTDPYDWRDHSVFRYKPEHIKSVEFVNYDSTQHNFRLNVLGTNLFELKDKNGKPVNNFDTTAVRAYLLNFNNINFLTLNRGHLSKTQEDSLKKAKPFIKLAVTNSDNFKDELVIYHKKAQASQVDLEGKPYAWDIEMAFARLKTGEIAVIQFGHFAKVLWPLQAFTVNSGYVNKR